MIKNRFLAAVMAVLAGVSVISCDELQEIIDTVIEVSISSDSDAFDANGQAVVKLNLNAASNKDINVIIGISAEAQSGFTAVSADALDFEGSVIIPAGTDMVPVTIKLNEKAQGGQQAVITIASASGASIGKNSVVYIKVPTEYGKNDQSGEENSSLAGASVWSIIGAFNNWAGDVELTKTDGEEWKINGFKLSGEFKFRGNKEWGDYDLGAASGAQIVFGQPLDLVQKGQNITIAEGVYDIVLYPTQLKAIFSPVEGPVGEYTFRQDWSGTLYAGSYEHSDGYKYAVIQTAGFADSEYYDMWYDYLPEEGLANLDVAELLAYSKETVDESYNYYGGKYSYDNFLYNGSNYWLVYPEVPETGDYVVYFVGYNTDGTLNNQYGYSTFSYEAPQTVEVTGKFREDWYAKWDGWEDGSEGEYFWVTGSAPGAAYIYAEWYTDEEIEEYFGDIDGMLSAYATDLQEYLADGGSLDNALAAVDADGSFETYLSTYEEVGPVNVYIIGFAADGTCLGDYGVSEVVIPEVEKVEINWEEKTDWKVAYDSTVDTGNPAYPQAVVVSACDAKYFMLVPAYAGALEEYGIDGIGEAVGDYSYAADYGYTMDDLVEMGYIGSSETLPYIYASRTIEEGDEIFVLGLDESGFFTGGWCMSVAENVVLPTVPEMALQADWSVTPVGDVYQDEDGDYLIDVEVVAPGIKYYIAEEDNQADLEKYYDGTLEGMAEYKQEDILLYMDYFECSVADLIYSAEDPQTDIYVYNLDEETSIYLLEFDEYGLATGRYGVTNVVIPSPAESEVEAPAKVKVNVKSLNAKKALDHKPILANKPVLEKKQHKAKVNTNAVKFGGKNVTVPTFESTKVMVKR